MQWPKSSFADILCENGNMLKSGEKTNKLYFGFVELPKLLTGVTIQH